MNVSAHTSSAGTYPELAVGRGEIPEVAGNPHPLVLRPQVYEAPGLLTVLLVHVGMIGEA